MCHNQPSSVRKAMGVSGWAWLQWARRILAGLLLIGSIYLTSSRTVCEEKLANTGNQGAVRVCHPLAVSDVPVLAGLLLVMLLLLPDLSEIGIPGFLSLKRQVSQQESKLEEQAARLVGLQAQLAQAIESQQTVTQNAETHAAAMNVNVYDFNALLRQAEAKAPDLFIAAHEYSHEAIPAARAQLEVQLLRIWAQLSEPIVQARQIDGRFEARRAHAQARIDALREQERGLDVRRELGKFSAEELQDQRMRMDMARAARHQADAELHELAKSQDQLRSMPAWKWCRDFQQEIEVVRATHEAVIQAEPIEGNKLNAAVRLAEGLLEAWKGRTNTPSKAGEVTAD